jgi:hypothetical protein
VRATAQLAFLTATLLLAGCDQSVNYSTLDESKLTGMYCDAKGDQQPTCKPGDVVLTVAAREHLLCDWGWQIVRQPDSDEVLCVYRGQLRNSRTPALPER